MDQLMHRIIQRIRNSRSGVISFRDYMRMCLYEPGLGYYTSDKPKIGKEGDFYTVSHVGTMMGELLARTFVKYWRERGAADLLIVEWGGGSGRLAGHILDELQRNYPNEYGRVRYQIVDASPYHRRLQAKTLDRHASAASAWLPEQWMEQELSGFPVIFSNELLDALPCYRIRKQEQEICEICVGYDESEGRLAERLMPVMHDDLREAIEADELDRLLADGQTAEVCTEAAEWIARMAGKLERGMMVTVDYGDEAERLYGNGRMDGTLRCYYQHQVHGDPFANPGRQDITADVNFTACMRAGEAAGMQTRLYATQKQFMLEAGILDMLQGHDGSDPFSPAARRNRAITQLLLDESMGDKFKVLIQTKDDRA